MPFKFGDMLGSILLISHEKDTEISFLEVNWNYSTQLKGGLSHIKCPEMESIPGLVDSAVVSVL